MLAIILQTTILYWTAGLDLLVLLVLLYVNYDKSRHREIMLGQMLGSGGLILVSLLLGVVFHILLPEWLLGFLGIIPIYFGIKVLLGKDDDEAEAAASVEKRKNKSLFWTTAIISFSSCGADNVGLFSPFLANLSLQKLWLATLTFLVNIVLLAILSDRFAHLPHLSDHLAKYSRWIIGIVYLLLGIFLFIEAGTFVEVGKLL